MKTNEELILIKLERLEHLLNAKEPKSEYYEVKPYDAYTKGIHAIGMDKVLGETLAIIVADLFVDIALKDRANFSVAHPVWTLTTKVGLVIGLNLLAPVAANLCKDFYKSILSPAYDTVHDYVYGESHIEDHQIQYSGENVYTIEI